MRRPGIEPGSTAWKATMLTITPPTPVIRRSFLFHSYTLCYETRKSKIEREKKFSLEEWKAKNKFFLIGKNVYKRMNIK